MGNTTRDASFRKLTLLSPSPRYECTHSQLTPARSGIYNQPHRCPSSPERFLVSNFKDSIAEPVGGLLLT